jgi:hypothetical protein
MHRAGSVAVGKIVSVNPGVTGIDDLPDLAMECRYQLSQESLGALQFITCQRALSSAW